MLAGHEGLTWRVSDSDGVSLPSSATMTRAASSRDYWHRRLRRSVGAELLLPLPLPLPRQTWVLLHPAQREDDFLTWPMGLLMPRVQWQVV